jgi:hypothetical protein
MGIIIERQPHPAQSMTDMSAMGNLKAGGVRCHEDLCFKDGNVILVAEGICFRVHSGQLTRQSDVFRGMMSIPQPVDAPMVDGCPVIELHDRAQELAYMLEALYDGLWVHALQLQYSVIHAPLMRDIGTLRRGWRSTSPSYLPFCACRPNTSSDAFDDAHWPGCGSTGLRRSSNGTRERGQRQHRMDYTSHRSYAPTRSSSLTSPGSYPFLRCCVQLSTTCPATLRLISSVDPQ